MGRPKRLDSPEKITLCLSALCHKQMLELCRTLRGGARAPAGNDAVGNRRAGCSGHAIEEDPAQFQEQKVTSHLGLCEFLMAIRLPMDDDMSNALDG